MARMGTLKANAPSDDAGGGVLPLYVFGNKCLVLLYNAVAGGKAKSLADLGGRREYFEPDGRIGLRLPSGKRPPSQLPETTFACAARELLEESWGLWGLADLFSPPLKSLFVEKPSDPSTLPTQSVQRLLAECKEVSLNA